MNAPGKVLTLVRIATGACLPKNCRPGCVRSRCWWSSLTSHFLWRIVSARPLHFMLAEAMHNRTMPCHTWWHFPSMPHMIALSIHVQKESASCPRLGPFSLSDHGSHSICHVLSLIHWAATLVCTARFEGSKRCPMASSGTELQCWWERALPPLYHAEISAKASILHELDLAVHLLGYFSVHPRFSDLRSTSLVTLHLAGYTLPHCPHSV